MSTWVLLRGLARESGHWGDFAARLQAQLGDAHRVVAPDLPGNGALHAQTSPSSVPGMVQALRDGLRARGIAPPYVLVALSLGGMVAIQWAHEAPGEIAACVLINTSVRGHGAFWQRLQARNYATLLRLFFSSSYTLREQAVMRMTSARPASHEHELSRWIAIAARRPVRAGNVVRQLVAAARYRPPAQWPSMPMLVLASQGDRLVAIECSKRLADAWQLPLRIHPDAGHDLPLDDEAWVLSQLEEFASLSFRA